MLCGNCGHELVSGATFCGNCGAPIAGAPVQPIVAQPGPNPAAPPPPATAQPIAPPPPAGTPPAQPAPQPVPAAQPQYTQPYQQPYQQAVPPQPGFNPNGLPVTERYNDMAIIALVLVFVFWPAAIIFGIIALKQIKQTHEKGKNLAVASLVLSILFTALFVLYMVAVFTLTASDTSTQPLNNIESPSTSEPIYSES